MSIHFTHFTSLENLTQAGAGLLFQYFRLIQSHPYAIMLSGGKTPLEIYRRLAGERGPVAKTLHLLWSDERMVPGDSPESNYGNTQELISALGIPPERLFAVRSSLPLDEAARDYHDQIQRFLDMGGTFPLGLLGLGGDGHTASLFNVEDTREKRGCWAIPVRRSQPPDRVSVTSELLSRFQRILFLVSGADKRDILRRFKEQPDSIPAGWAVRDVNQIDVWCCVNED